MTVAEQAPGAGWESGRLSSPTHATGALAGAGQPPITAPAVQLRDVTREYGSGASRFAAVRDVDLDIRAGEFVAIMGRSGSGKSTLLHLIAALDPPTRGSVRIDGIDVGGLTDEALTQLRRRRIGLVFQSFNLVEVLSAEENVALPLVIDGVPEAQANAKALRLLERVGLAARRDHLPKEMSGGEQQRVAIARALVAEPLLLLADEPTGNLDSASSEQIIALLKDLMRDRRQTIVMVTHDVRQAEVADRVIEIRDGEVVRDTGTSMPD